MGGNRFGKCFSITTFGASHGKAMGVVIEGCPAGLSLTESDLEEDLQRRRPGQSHLTTSRNEADKAEIISGVFQGKTTGDPICIMIANKDQRSKDYDHIKQSYRPSHADFTYEKKYGLRDSRGGGRASARETVARVAAGSVAKKILAQFNVSIVGFVSQVGDVEFTTEDLTKISTDRVEESILRCPDVEVSVQMQNHIEQAQTDGDSVGGVITCVVKDVPVGLGEPVFDKLHADLGKAMLSIQAVKGFEIGSGFNAVTMRGSEHNDVFENIDGEIRTKTNHSGGIQGGISNGMPIYFRVAFKPVSTIMKDQDSVNQEGDSVVVSGKGRHDPCVVPRAVPIVEAMTALTLVDHMMRQQYVRLDQIEF